MFHHLTETQFQVIHPSHALHKILFCNIPTYWDSWICMPLMTFARRDEASERKVADIMYLSS